MYKIIVLPFFRRQIKRHIKKYPSIKNEVIKTLKNFDKNRYIKIRGNVYKIRLRIKELPKGKSKSFRLIVLVIEVEKFLVPVALYFKGERETLTIKEVNYALEVIFFELKAENLLL